MTEAIESRIEKLLRVADGNANENESANALRLAQALADAHNLDLGQIGKTGARKDSNVGKGLYKYQRTLYEKLAALNHCNVWITKGIERGSKYQTRLLGSKVNVTMVTVMADYVEEVGNRLAKERYGKVGYFSRDAHIFREGFVDKMIERITERRQQEEQDRERAKREQEARSSHPGAATENAIVLISDVAKEEEKANYDYLHGEGSWEELLAKQAKANQDWLDRKEEAARRRAEMDRQYEAWAKDHPEEAAAKVAAEAEKAEEERKQREKDNARWERQWDRAAARREKAKEARIAKHGYDPEDFKQSKDVQRRSSAAYRAGRAEAANVSIDDQIDAEGRKAIS